MPNPIRPGLFKNTEFVQFFLRRLFSDDIYPPHWYAIKNKPFLKVLNDILALLEEKTGNRVMNLEGGDHQRVKTEEMRATSMKLDLTVTDFPQEHTITVQSRLRQHTLYSFKRKFWPWVRLR